MKVLSEFLVEELKKKDRRGSASRAIGMQKHPMKNGKTIR